MNLGKVLVKEREIYGVLKFYPHNDTAKLFCEIAKAKTLTMENLQRIKKMGFEVVSDRVAFGE